jgi:hypothetical protein
MRRRNIRAPPRSPAYRRQWAVWQHALEACERHYGTPVDVHDPIAHRRFVVDDISRAMGGFWHQVSMPCSRYVKHAESGSTLEIEGGCQRICNRPKPVVRRQDAPACWSTLRRLRSPILRTCGFSPATHVRSISQDKSLDIDGDFDFELVTFCCAAA